MHHSQQLQNDKDDCNYEQDVDDIPHFRDSGTYRPTEKAEQPQDQKNDDDYPQHEISPLRRLERAGLPA
jgi:hypothetical protein